MIGRLSRSWTLAMQCWDVLKQDKTLMIFPILSGFAVVLVSLSFALPVWTLMHATEAVSGAAMRHSNSSIVFAVLFYAANYFVVFFFNTALVSVALERLEGREASLGEGLRVALSRLPVILMYALIAASVGAVLRAIEERVGLIGRIVIGVIGFAWSVATTLVVPVLAAEGVGPFEAIGRSVELLKKSWGENIVGNGGIGFAVFLAMLAVAIVGGTLMVLALQAHSIGLVVLAGFATLVMILGVAVVSSALHTIYTAALYRYATGGDHWTTIDRDLMGTAFRPR